jgi:hypothetical protein
MIARLTRSSRFSDAVYLFGEIDGGKHRFLHPFVIRGRLILSEREASGKEGQRGRRQGDDRRAAVVAIFLTLF